MLNSLTKICFFIEIELVNKFGDDKPKEFIADHPFMFYIEDDITGAKLFAGRVTDPKF